MWSRLGAWMAPALVAAVLSLASGCSLSYFADYYDEPPLVALFPGEGAAAVPDETVPRVELAWSLDTPPAMHVELWEADHTPMELPCALSGMGDQVMVCDLPEPLDNDTTYTVAAWLDEDPAIGFENTFVTSVPEGLEYDLGSEMNVTRLGSNALAASVFESVINGADEAPLLLVAQNLTDDTQLPATEKHWVWGPGKVIVEETGTRFAMRHSVGYPFAMHTIIDTDGAVFGTAEYTYLPVGIDHEWRFVRIDDLTLTGQLRPNEYGKPVETLTAEGYLTVTSALRLLSYLSGAQAAALSGMLDLDTDRDGDGTVDAARLVMETSALPTAIFEN